MSTLTAATAARKGPLARLARWSIRHRRIVVVSWVVLLVGAGLVSSSVGTRYATDFKLPGSESQRALDMLKRDFPAQAGDSDQIVLHARAGKVTDAAVRARVAPVLERISHLPHVTGVTSPYSAAGSKAVSKDGRIAFATVTFDQRANELPNAAVNRVIHAGEGLRSGSLQVEFGGQAIQQVQQPSLGAATAVGLIAAIVVLLITFGSLIAMGLPIVTALLGLGTGIGVIGLASQVLDMPDVSTELAVMIGLGVGIDYSLFIVTRFREAYRGGMGVSDAVVTAMDTAGRAVLFAGATVIIALLGMLTLGVSFLYGLAVASALAVLLTMLASLTIVPALLSRFGERIGRGRRRAAAQVPPAPEVAASSGFWARWASFIQRRPWPALLAGLAIMLVLASPALSMRQGTSDAGNDPTSLTTRRAYDLLAEGFGKGFNGPLLVAASLPDGASQASLSRISTALRSSPDVASVGAARVSPNGRTAVFNVYPKSAPEAAATTSLVKRLRSSELPPVAAATNGTIYVAGATAIQIDLTDVMSSKLPLFIGIVVGLSALLLLVVFRSVVIPLKAAAMNLLSIGAALGVVVAVFQWGWLGGVFGVKGGPIDAFIPVLLFAIVFGLSMDYEVFLVSRIHEEWTRRRDPSRAVTHGLASTGRVITAAATIMVFVFLSFVLGSLRPVKLFGLSLASAVFLDAFVVRCLLVPAALELLGRVAWALPGRLDRVLPHLAIDPPDVEPLPSEAG
jgi:putative drug exporter of the RND superfamily